MILFKKKKLEKEKKKFLERINQYLIFDRDYIRSLEYVEGDKVKSTACHQNLKCHMVSRTMANADSNLKVKACICRNKNSLFVHFINYDTENEIYIDNTLGVGSNQYDYFILNCDWLDYDRYKENPDEMLEAVKIDFFRRFCNNSKLIDEMRNYFGVDDII